MTLLLQASELELEVFDGESWRCILRGLTLGVNCGEIVGLVGESGSGKSVTALAVLELLPPGEFRIASGTLTTMGRNVDLSGRSVADLRGRRASIVFQEPMTSLNPTRRVGAQLADVLRRHRHQTGSQAMLTAADLLSEMLVDDPCRVLASYPHQLSGGLRQRVLLAMALACDVDLLVADEPTTALDVTVQAQIIALIREQARKRGLAVLFITHDLALARQICDRICVIYAGAIVESGPAESVLERPAHPYTRALKSALPAATQSKSRLAAIDGLVPGPGPIPEGCSFAPRCPNRASRCEQERPGACESADGSGHFVSCHRFEELWR